jgi:hypothetical protein
MEDILLQFSLSRTLSCKANYETIFLEKWLTHFGWVWVVADGDQVLAAEPGLDDPSPRSGEGSVIPVGHSLDGF